MNLPRWTAYAAVGVLLLVAVSAIPNREATNPHEGAARAARAAAGAASTVVPAEHDRVVVLGIDGLDPEILRDVMERRPEGMANFRRLAESGQGVLALGTSTPPQSPVAWSNFITGRNPGGHGVFDFIHRDPETYDVAPSTVKSTSGGELHVPFTGYKVPTGGSSESNRTGRAFWTVLMENGVPADLYRVPIDYPVEPSDGWSIPGMLTPALDSAYGSYTIWTTDPPARLETNGGRFVPVRPRMGKVGTKLYGPPNALKEGDPVATAPLDVFLDEVGGVAVVRVGGATVVLEPGQWSDWVPVQFEMLPLGAMNLSGVVRFRLLSLEPEFELYASPVNFDPRNPVEPISYPEDVSAEVAERLGGAYYTQGMAEEVSALKDGAFTDEEFMDQVDLVYRERVRMLDLALDRYAESDRGGLLFFYVSTIDLTMHMMWRHQDPEHPFHDPDLASQDSSRWSGRPGSTWAEVVDDLYLKMDPIVGRILDRVGDDALVVVMSDHGFAPYRRKFSLNTWLLEEGYLVLKDGAEREKPEGDPEHFPVYLSDAVDWSRTRAYGIGFNGLYLNLKGREAEGVVEPGGEADRLRAELERKLEDVVDDENGGRRVVLAADVFSDVYDGERLAESPDIVVGYNSGYGNSDEATQGRIPHAVLTDNLGGTFNGSHLMHPSVVSGTLLTNGRVVLDDPRLEDLTVTILDAYGVAKDEAMVGRPILE